jgi:hypothetical protein
MVSSPSKFVSSVESVVKTLIKDHLQKMQLDRIFAFCSTPEGRERIQAKKLGERKAAEEA